MQKHVNLVDLVKSFPNVYWQNLASIQKRTSPMKFDHLAEKSEYDSISNLSTKGEAGDVLPRVHRVPPAAAGGEVRELRDGVRGVAVHEEHVGGGHCAVADPAVVQIRDRRGHLGPTQTTFHVSFQTL